MATKSQDFSRRSFCKCTAAACPEWRGLPHPGPEARSSEGQGDAEAGLVPGHAERHPAMRQMQTVSAAERLRIG